MCLIRRDVIIEYEEEEEVMQGKIRTEKAGGCPEKESPSLEEARNMGMVESGEKKLKDFKRKNLWD